MEDFLLCEHASTEWLPIESAPRTSDDLVIIPVLGFCPKEGNGFTDDRIRIIWWEPLICGGCWYDDSGKRLEPTHWQPLPEPPAHVTTLW